MLSQRFEYSRNMKITPRTMSSTASRPHADHPNCGASSRESVMRTPHIVNQADDKRRLRIARAAQNTGDNDRRRKERLRKRDDAPAPARRAPITSGSVEKIEMSCGARKNRPAPASVIIMMPMYVAIRLNRSARSLRFAPSACPTSVVPAEATPNAGM